MSISRVKRIEILLKQTKFELFCSRCFSASLPNQKIEYFCNRLSIQTTDRKFFLFRSRNIYEKFCKNRFGCGVIRDRINFSRSIFLLRVFLHRLFNRRKLGNFPARTRLLFGTAFCHDNRNRADGCFADADLVSVFQQKETLRSINARRYPSRNLSARV